MTDAHKIAICAYRKQNDKTTRDNYKKIPAMVDLPLSFEKGEGRR